jgi:hypothetical protein
VVQHDDEHRSRHDQQHGQNIGTGPLHYERGTKVTKG